MKKGILLRNSMWLTKLTACALVVIAFATSSQGVNVALSGTSQENNQAIIDFINNNFADVNLTFGDYSNIGDTNVAAIINNSDVFIIGRALSSTAYANAVNSAAFNALNLPVVSFTSYVVRPDGDRWGWHDGAVAFGDTTGDETTVTAAGAGVLGPEGAASWWDTDYGFSALGTGLIGDGDVLATMGGNILVAHWDAGDLTGMGATLGGERLLFNLSDATSGGPAVMPDSAAGQMALMNALDAYTPLVAIPEPATLGLFGIAGAAFLFIRRRFTM